MTDIVGTYPQLCERMEQHDEKCVELMAVADMVAARDGKNDVFRFWKDGAERRSMLANAIEEELDYGKPLDQVLRVIEEFPPADAPEGGAYNPEDFDPDNWV